MKYGISMQMSWRADEAERESRGQQREASNLRGQEQSRERHDDQAEAGPDARETGERVRDKQTLQTRSDASRLLLGRRRGHRWSVCPCALGEWPGPRRQGRKWEMREKEGGPEKWVCTEIEPKFGSLIGKWKKR